MGHEFTGEVVEAGSAVTSLKLGDQVVSAFTTACGQCFFAFAVLARDVYTIRSMVGEKRQRAPGCSGRIC
ncbi:MAG: alcohol dehydrogenase catalytic domain-containing protein [Saprospiraceae bacterium]|nr:alcohol dehydrogenase catalytic domain-containing protein [Saprospiraceae bacterium]